jgi:hypothetical protein
MFVNLETSDFREAMCVHGAEAWDRMAIGFLERYDRNVAVGKMAEAIQCKAGEQAVPENPLLATLFSCALRRVDFYTLALELVQRAESANPSLIERAVDEDQVADEDLLDA